jgi:hypothetical protein
MADVGPDLGYCETCAQFLHGQFIKDVFYCHEHVPVQLDADDFEMIYEKAGVPGPDACYSAARLVWKKVVGML